MKKFPYGSVLKIQREHSFGDIERRLDKMKATGMNTAVIWPAVYWWEDETTERYPYATGHHILQYAEQIGLDIVMELAGQLASLEYVPDFLMKDEYYAVKYEGHYAKDKNQYDYVNYNHPEVKALIKQQYSEIAQNYKGYAALAGYDIWNETMFESYDEYTLQIFQGWLKQKYTSLRALNDAWDRVFKDWSQITFNRWMWASVMPRVDYRRFQKENIGLILEEWASHIKAEDTVHPVIADNVHSSTTASNKSYERPQDDWNVAEHVDQFGISFYPKILRNMMMSDHKRWQVFTGAHSATRDGRFWVSEMQTHTQHFFSSGSAVSPKELTLWNWEAISHGANAIIYWMWEPFIKGLQTFGRGLVDVNGQDTPRSTVAKDIGRVISQHEDAFVEYAPEPPRTAILFDKSCQDFFKAYIHHYKHRTSDSIYIDSLVGVYWALWEKNIATEFVVPKDFSLESIHDYKAIFVSNQLNIDPEFAQGILEFVKQGGTVIADGKFGEITDDGVLYRELPGGPLNEILGCRHIDMNDEDFHITIDAKSGQHFGLDGYFEKRELELRGENAEMFGRFADGYPGAIRSTYGQGQIIYIPTFLWYGFSQEQYSSVLEFVEFLDSDLDLKLHSSDNNQVKFVTTKGPDGVMVFAFNYHEAELSSTIHLTGLNADACLAENIYTGEEREISSQDGAFPVSVTVEPKAVTITQITKK